MGELMSETLIDHEAIRARVERRLAPRIHLLQRRARLFIHIFVFLAAMALIYSTNSPLFHYVENYTIGAYSFPNPEGKLIDMPAQTYQMHQIYPVISALSWIWFLLVIFHILTIWRAFSRERMIQRE